MTYDFDGFLAGFLIARLDPNLTICARNFNPDCARAGKANIVGNIVFPCAK